jgi:hypothetical protein
MIPPLIVLLAWIPFSFYFFRQYPIRVAILINFVSGWAILPTAAFAASSARFPYWIIGTCLPSIYFVTKASVTGAACVAGVLWFDRGSVGRFRLSYWDAPMLVWCVIPLLSGLANKGDVGSSLRGEIYQILAWGIPYLCGRIYFSSADALLLAAKGFVIAGLGYVPICLMEFFTGPQIYAFLYGYQPYRWVGSGRYLGFRPVGLLEDGNQLGIWMATSALIAVWLWRRGLVTEILGMPIAWTSCLLLTVTLLCQSAGSIIVLIALLPFLFFSQRYVARIFIAVLLLGILSLTGLRLANVISLRSLVSHNAAASMTARLLLKTGRASFGWRLWQDEKHVGIALERPILGSGEWDWWKGSSSRPWSLWLLSFGMYGIVGLLALQMLQLIPVVRSVWHPLAHSETDGYDLRRGLAAVILMSAIDNLLNGSMILPLAILIGGLSGPTCLPSEAGTDTLKMDMSAVRDLA